MVKEPKKEARIKFPLIATDDSLQKLLSNMIGKAEAKKVLYASENASQAQDD